MQPTLLSRRVTADALGTAYWFTASTSFANPAVTLARSLSDTFAGIAPADVFGFIIAQGIGAVAAMLLFGWLWRSRKSQSDA